MIHDFVPPSLDEIVAVLTAHPLIRLRENVKRGFLVGSFAKRLARPRGSPEGESDVDILLEVEPRRGVTAEELEDHYRQALRQYFVTHNIRGKADEIHPQWDGRRVDLYFTYNADLEIRPMRPLWEPNPGRSGAFGAWGREEFKFIGTGDIVEQIRSLDTDRVFDPSEDEDREPRWRSVIYGQNVKWAAKPGHMLQIPRANVEFMPENIWDLEHAASIYRYMREMRSSMEPIRLPAGRVHRVTVADVKMSERFEAEGELDEQLGMTEPWTWDEVGTYETRLVDGNHRAAAALALGEPYIWIYVAENSMGEVRKKDLK